MILSLRLFVLGFCALTCSVAVAQDYYAVAGRLKEAVQNGEITQKQADVMMIALKKSGIQSKQQKQHPQDQDAETIAKQLKAAVAAGKLTEKEAYAKWKAIQVVGAKKKAKPAAKELEAETEAYLKQVWAKLQAMVKAGKLTEAEAKAKMVAIKKEKLDTKTEKGTNYQEIWDKLQWQVKAGDLTAEQARAAMVAIKKAGKSE